MCQWSMTRPERQMQVITRAQSISLSFAVCLGLSTNLQNLCRNQHGTHVIDLLISTRAHVKREGQDFKKKENANIAEAAVIAFLL